MEKMVQLQNKTKIFSLMLLLAILLNMPASAEKTIHCDALNDKMRGMWLGQLIANYAGRETEGHFSGSSGNPDPCVPWIIKLEWGADDDTDIEYIAMHILETNGFDCNSQELADQWLEHITSWGIYISNRQAWYLMGDGYLPPDTGSRTYNEHWYSIDSQITTEVLGAISPGLVQQALDLTGKFAHISNEGFPVHAAQFYSAMYANAFFEPNVVTLVNQGLAAIPTTSRTYQVVSDVLNWYLDDINDGELDWRDARRKLYDYYQGSYSYGRYYNWLESAINAGATTLAILYGQGDFKQTVQIGVLAGWDCDCNPATAGGLIGIIEGYSGLPSDLTNPAICGNVYKNVYRPYLPDPNFYRPQYEDITSIASRLTSLAVQNILENGGWTDSNDPNIYHIPDVNFVPEPEKPDPNGPKGLVAAAIEAGIGISTSAAVEYHLTSYDRRNLDSIIDGITDNSYNGHKPYYSYLSDPSARPGIDWYQINFSEPVKFDSLIFYEGDIDWRGINTYVKDDESDGGFFEYLTVEILSDGKFISPADLQMTPNLDRCKMYQKIAFNFAPTVGVAIRIIGTAGGGYSYTTIMELEAYGDLDPVYVKSVRIADGQKQRSDVKTIELQFSRDVTITKDDIQLQGTTNYTFVDINDIGFSYDPNTLWAVLSFASSLPDDTYDLRLDCNSITAADSTILLDGDSNPHDGFHTIEFHRLFGDIDGSAMVDLYDFAAVATAWLTIDGDENYNSVCDLSTDNAIDEADLAVLAEMWLKGP